MSAGALVIAAIVLVVGLILGWYANRTHLAHGDVKTTRARIAGYRRVRLRSGLIALAAIVIGLLVVAAVITHK